MFKNISNCVGLQYMFPPIVFNSPSDVISLLRKLALPPIDSNLPSDVTLLS